MDNQTKISKKASIRLRPGTKRGTKNKNNLRSSSGNQSKALYERGSKSKKRKSNLSRKGFGPRGTSPEVWQEARLSKLEETIVSQMNHPDTPFAYINALGNPGTAEITALPAFSTWWESFRTTASEPYNETIRRTQEVLFGGLIQSSRTDEAEARAECYWLLEEVESRLVGYMPNLGPTTEVINPIVDVDAVFSQIGQNGEYGLTVMFQLTWQVVQTTKEV